MPTINQLVRKPRSKASDKSKSPALQRVTNNLKTKNYEKPGAVQARCLRQGHDQDPKEAELSPS